MRRVNLTLDEDTGARLKQHAARAGRPAAALARDLVREGLARREALERARRLARDYAAGREDARELLRDLETPQLETLLNDAD